MAFSFPATHSIQLLWIANYSTHLYSDCMPATNENFWKTRAKRLSRTINAGWFLERVTIPFVLTVCLIAAFTLIARRMNWEVPLWLALLIPIAVLITVSLVVFSSLRKKFETSDTTLIRFEAQRNLNSSLSTANQGVQAWPHPVPTCEHRIYVWKYRTTLAPFAFAILILVSSFLIPIPSTGKEVQSIDEPPAWSEIDSTLDHLAEQSKIDQTYIKERQEQLEALRGQEADEWFSHSSLEATDHLQRSLRQDAETLKNDAETAKIVLEEFHTQGAKGNATEQAKAHQEFEKALEALENNAMKPNAELMNKLGEAGKDALTEPTEAQIEQLRENLRQLQEQANMGADDLGEENGSEGGKIGEEQNSAGNQEPGSGQTDQGPGHDPELYGKERNPPAIGKLTPLAAFDLSDLTPGDLLELQQGTHDPTKGSTGLSAGGDGTEGTGGDGVWQGSLDPAEQRALKNYFE